MTDNDPAELKTRIRQLAAEVSLAEERERRQIASDLHDHLGQALAYVKVKLLQLQADMVFSGSDETWSEVISLLDQSIKYTRTLTCEISPPVLYELGLGPALVWLAEEFQEKRNLRVDARIPDPLPVAFDLQVILFKSVRELLLNVIQHAGVTRARMRARVGADQVEIEVSDDGVGFDTEAAARHRAGPSGGFGLYSTRERIESLGGALTLDSRPGAGTTATLTAPIEPDGLP